MNSARKIINKTNKFLLSLLTALLITANIAAQKAEIRYNQIGYFPKGVKKAVVVNTGEKVFFVKTTRGETVFKGKLKKSGFWDKSGEEVKIADFSTFTTQGKYVLYVKDAPSTCPFEIKNNIYDDAFKASLKSYYLIRASMDIDEKYAGVYHRKEGHPDTLAYFHPSAQRGEGHASSPKGWYDAGDYNKYVVNGGVTVGTLLALADIYPELVDDGFSNIPESGNGVSDLLDEVKYELEWVLTMQTADGASNMKLTSKGFTGFILPEKDKTERYFVGKATAPSLNFAAMMAMAARIYKDVDSDFSNKCLAAAERAWAWAEKNPNVVYKNPKDVKTGEYGDADFKEEFWWAASELYLTTHKKQYENYIASHEPYMEFNVGESWRVFLGNLGSFSLLISNNRLPDNLQSKLQKKLYKTADGLLKKLQSVPYRIPVDEFVWGSNSDIQNAAMMLAFAYKLSGDKKYLDGAVETMDYIFGKNATGYSFLTGFGCKRVKHVHNRISGADNIDEPLPGLVAGGPNNNREDDISKTKFGVEYPNKLPAKAYVDNQKSYASNETAINWNAPAVFMLGFLEANARNLQ
jgi:endoglucanase